jgi:hypothetical protein
VAGDDIVTIVYLLGIFPCAYLFSRAAADPAASFAALFWPIALPIGFIVWLALLGEKHGKRK